MYKRLNNITCTGKVFEEEYVYPLEKELDPRLEVELIVVDAFSLMLDINPEDLDIVLDKESNILAFKLSRVLLLLGDGLVLLMTEATAVVVPILGLLLVLVVISVMGGLSRRSGEGLSFWRRGRGGRRYPQGPKD